MPNIPKIIPTGPAPILEDIYYMVYLGLWSAKSPADHNRVKDFATSLLKLGLLDRPVMFNGQQYGDNYGGMANNQYHHEVARNIPIQTRQNFGFWFFCKLLRGFFLIVILYTLREYRF